MSADAGPAATVEAERYTAPTGFPDRVRFQTASDWIDSGHHALHRQGITTAFCMAHAHRKLFEVFKLNGSQIAGQAVALIAKLYEIEREVKEFSNGDKLLARQQRSKPVADALHAWLTTQRERLPTLKDRDLAQLLPHNWQPASATVEPGTEAAAATA